MSIPYRGRFAPTPSGPLHFGSLVAATGSYLQARSQQGEWFVRIDDIDPPREQKGAAQLILTTLEDFGFEWDGEVHYQSQRQQRYQQAVDTLQQSGHAYRCNCSRSLIRQRTGQQQGELVYPGFCRQAPPPPDQPHAIRLQVEQQSCCFHDAIQGDISLMLHERCGDFVIQRRDGLFSYHLATGIDDAEQGVTEVVRGADLLDTTPCQHIVQSLLGLPTPRYAHLPIARDSNGQKLSKQSHAPALDRKQAPLLLYKTLKFLGQLPPLSLQDASLYEIWDWAIANWQLTQVPSGNKQITAH